MMNNSFRVSLIYYLGVLGGALAFGVFDQNHVLVGKINYKSSKIGYVPTKYVHVCMFVLI